MTARDANASKLLEVLEIRIYLRLFIQRFPSSFQENRWNGEGPMAGLQR